MSLGTSHSQVAQVIITELKCWSSLYVYIHTLYVTHTLSTHKKQRPCHAPTDLRAAGSGPTEEPLEQALHKPATAPLCKGFRTGDLCDEDVWIYFPQSRLLKSSFFNKIKIIRTGEIDVLANGVRFKIFCLYKRVCCSLVVCCFLFWGCEHKVSNTTRYEWKCWVVQMAL